MSEKLSPLLQALERKPKPKSLWLRYFDTAVIGLAVIVAVPLTCIAAIVAFPLWVIGMVVSRYFINEGKTNAQDEW